MGSLVLAGATSGSTTITPSATGTYTITLPAETGTIQTSGAGFTTNGVAYASSTSALTTGSALSFTGTNLGIGTSTPSRILELSTSLPALALRATGQATDQKYWEFSVAGTLLRGAVQNDANTTEAFWMEVQRGAGNAITSVSFPLSNVGIGTSSPTSNGSGNTVLDIASGSAKNANLFLHGNNTSGASAGFQIQSASDATVYLWNYANTYMAFATNNTERMRIDSSGNVGIGTSSPTFKLDVAGQSRIVANVNGDYAVQFSNSNTNNPYGLFVALAYAGSPQYIFVGYYAGIGNVVFINYNGNITNYNNSYGAISDVKLKENIVDATPKLEDLCKVKVRQYNFKEGEKHKQIGVIAQELEEIFPSMIEESKDTIKDEDGKMIELNTVTKSVKYSVFVPMLIKAIQEQQSTIQSLTERITALEGART